MCVRVCVCVHACVRACVCVCVRVHVTSAKCAPGVSPSGSTSMLMVRAARYARTHANDTVSMLKFNINMYIHTYVHMFYTHAQQVHPPGV